MITEAFISISMAILNTVFILIPTIPPMPALVVNSLNVIMDMMVLPVGTIKYFVGSTMFNAYIAMIVALLLFEQIYYLIMWILRKIPIIGIN